MGNEQEKPTVSSPTCTALLCCPFCGGDDFKYSVGHVNAAEKVEGTWVISASMDCYNCHTRKNQIKLFRAGSYKQAKHLAVKQVQKEWNQRSP